MPTPERDRLILDLSPEDAEKLLFDWPLWARPAQLEPPGDWLTWLILAGRGFGKTRAGVEWVIARAKSNPGHRIALVGRTAGDVRDTMVEGQSGIMACSPPWFMPQYESSNRRVVWPNGAQATTFTAEEPDALRGPQHHDAWADEAASWKYPEDTWDNLQFGLRLGKHPRVVVTTTPRPIKLIRELKSDPTTKVTTGSTFENAANLAATALAKWKKKYEGTTLGRQELYAEVLDDVPGALWTRALVEATRVKQAPELLRVVVGVDPAVTSGEESDDTGIVAAGIGIDGEYYVLADRTCHLSPGGWAKRVLIAHDEFEGDRVVGEVNNGGDLVERNLRVERPNVPFKAVRASRGKRVRAEPVAALYEQKKVHHVGALAELEDQMVTYLPAGTEKSPDRVDALVWAITDLQENGPINFNPNAVPSQRRSW